MNTQVFFYSVRSFTMTSMSTDQPPDEETVDEEYEDMGDDSSKGDLAGQAGMVFLLLEAFTLIQGKYGFVMK